MPKGKLIFVSGLAGSGKTTLIDGAPERTENLETLLTYATRPRRVEETSSYAYEFVSEEEYRIKKESSPNWDETIYSGHKYGADVNRCVNDLNQGVNIIVSVTPDMDDIHKMAELYGIEPVTIWINTPRSVAAARVRGDQLRSQRNEDESVKNQFDIIFDPVGDLDGDCNKFTDLIRDMIS